MNERYKSAIIKDMFGVTFINFEKPVKVQERDKLVKRLSDKYNRGFGKVDLLTDISLNLNGCRLVMKYSSDDVEEKEEEANVKICTRLYMSDEIAGYYMQFAEEEGEEEDMLIFCEWD